MHPYMIVYRYTDAFTCTRPLYPARKCYAHLLRRKGSGGRVTSFSASFSHEVWSCEVIPTMIGRLKCLTVAFEYFMSLLRTRSYAWAWKMQLIRRIGSRKERAA